MSEQDATEFTGGLHGVPQFQDRKEMWESLRVEPVDTKGFPAVLEWVRRLEWLPALALLLVAVVLSGKYRLTK